MSNLLLKTRSILVRREKVKLVFLGVGSILLSISEALSIGIIIPIISLFISPGLVHSSKWFRWAYCATGAQDEREFLILLTITALILFFVKFVYSIVMIYNQQKMLGDIYDRITSDALRAYLTKPYKFHLMHNSSILFKNVSQEVSNCVYYFLSPAITIGSEALILAGICLVLIIAYPVPIILLIGCVGIAALILHYMVGARIKVYAEQRKNSSGRMYKSALEALGAVKELQVYDVSGFFARRYAEDTKRYTDGCVKFSIISILPRYIYEMLFVTFILLAIVIIQIFSKNSAEFIPALTVLGVSALRILPSFSKIYSAINHLHFSENSLDVIHGILHEDMDDQCCRENVRINKKTVKDDMLSLDGVTFCYDKSSCPILKDFSLNVKLGQITAIIGKTGAGKSTLIDIMMGLLNPIEGNLVYRGSIVEGREIGEYRKKIGYVLQNIFLIDDTIAANVAFGINKSHIDENRVSVAIRHAQLESFIADLPDGLNTVIGERGVRISGGQRQRIGIARALYRNPEILILDEATSALDKKTEDDFYRDIINYRHGMTIVIITHRLNTLHHADMIYIIENGKIVESGDYNKFINESPYLHDIKVND